MKKEFRRDIFLLWMLAGVFIFQAAVFIFAIYGCFSLGGLDNCPEIGRRYDQTFGVMIATILALLTGSNVVRGVNQANEKKNEAAASEGLPPIARQKPKNPDKP